MREHFAQALAPVGGRVRRGRVGLRRGLRQGAVFVDLGLRYGPSVLKTRWTVRPHAARTGRSRTSSSSIPGISLAGEVGRLLGPEPVRRHDAAQRGPRPRAAARRRLPRDPRRSPSSSGAGSRPKAPASSGSRPPFRRCSFSVDGALAVHRALSEPYALVESLPPQPWRQPRSSPSPLRRTAGRRRPAPRGTRRSRPGPRPGRSTTRWDSPPARAATRPRPRRISSARSPEAPPAPGAGRSSRPLALTDGRLAEARSLLQRYLREAGPDPDTLATLAVVETEPRRHRRRRRDDADGARAASERAGRRPSSRPRSTPARATRRRPSRRCARSKAEGQLDRAVLRADPAYLSIATDPAWVGFLAEASRGSSTPPPTSSSPRTSPFPRGPSPRAAPRRTRPRPRESRARMQVTAPTPRTATRYSTMRERLGIRGAHGRRAAGPARSPPRARRRSAPDAARRAAGTSRTRILRPSHHCASPS